MVFTGGRGGNGGAIGRPPSDFCPSTEACPPRLAEGRRDFRLSTGASDLPLAPSLSREGLPPTAYRLPPGRFLLSAKTLLRAIEGRRWFRVGKD